MNRSRTDSRTAPAFHASANLHTATAPDAAANLHAADPIQDFHHLRFDSIQALRGLAALLVVWEHIRFFGRGAFGVDIFFCISGFMIMFTTQKPSPHFLAKRLIRILPFYWLMTLGAYGLLLLFPHMFEQTQAKPVFLIKSLFFLPFDIGGGVLQPLYRIGWTLNCEMFFYLIFYISMRISHRWRGLLVSLMLASAVLSQYLFSSDIAFLRFFGQAHMLEFALGIACYYMARPIYSLFSGLRLCPASRLSLRHTPVPEKNRHGLIGLLSYSAGCCSLLLSLGIMVVLILYKPVTPIEGFGRLFYWGLPSALIFMGFFISGLCIPFPPAMVWIGNISFSVYLLHYYIILFADRKIWDFSHLTPSSLAGAIASTLAVLALSAPASFLIEKKLTGLLMSLLMSLLMKLTGRS